ncbi:mediator of RNA polymerase II transcription subunit 15a-like [Solanum tuberosum]|uniref:Transcription cofactor n=1 Tax=Solanum tuberosum TaxID=4113 RepID=M1AGY7_SOLTU|nr:PREDICTED: mediator of RNA polymerase II transcription subunit 15a-like [Solanum tuberosum]
MDSGDWRTQLLPDLRQRIGNMIMETLKRHVSVSGQERVQELKEIAVTFEEKIYPTATSQQDYLQKISSKMLIVETRRSQNLIQPNPASSRQNALGQGSHNMQSQVNSQAQQLPVPTVANQTQTRQPLLQQNLQNNMASTGLQNSASLAPALPSRQNLPAVDESKNVANVPEIFNEASPNK